MLVRLGLGLGDSVSEVRVRFRHSKVTLVKLSGLGDSVSRGDTCSHRQCNNNKALPV